MRLAFTKNQWERMSEILGNFGLLVLASFVLPFFTDNLDTPKLIWGVGITVICWYTSITLAKKY